MEAIESTLAAQQFPPLGPVQVLVRRQAGRVTVPVGEGQVCLDVVPDQLVSHHGQWWLRGYLIERVKEPGHYYGWRFYGRVAAGDLRLDVPATQLKAA